MRNPAHLWDMLEAATSILLYVRGMPAETYLAQKVVRRAVERELEIIGEAARRVSESYRAQHPEIPWRLIIGQRNVLAHEYGEIRHERIWKLIQVDLPGFVAILETLVPLPPEESQAPRD